MKLNNSKSRNSSGSSQKAQGAQEPQPQQSSTSEAPGALTNPLLTGLLEQSAEIGKTYAPLLLRVAWASAGMEIAGMPQDELFPQEQGQNDPNQNQSLLRQALEAVHGAETVELYLPGGINTLLLEASDDDESTDEPHFVTADDTPAAADAATTDI